MGIGTGNGGNLSDQDAMSTKTGKWERLHAPNGVDPANDFVVYAISEDGACSYVDDTSVIEARGAD